MIFILYILMIIYPLASGFKDGVLWSLKGTDAFKGDEHKIFTAERICITLVRLLMVCGWYFDFIQPIDCIIAEVCYSMSFPFFQVGSYFESRKKIDRAYRGFWDDSTTSTAKLNFSFKTRTILLIISLLILIIYATIIN